MARPILLDGNLLVALAVDSHIHHSRAITWLAREKPASIALCPITQGTLVRTLVRETGQIEVALNSLRLLKQMPSYVFWNDDVDYADVRLVGVAGHRQVTDAYLAGLARHHGGRLATLDAALAGMHPDVAFQVP